MKLHRLHCTGCFPSLSRVRRYLTTVRKGFWTYGSCGNPPGAHPLLPGAPAPTLSAPAGHSRHSLLTALPPTGLLVRPPLLFCTLPAFLPEPPVSAHVCQNRLPAALTLSCTALQGVPRGEQSAPVQDSTELLASLRALHTVKKGMLHTGFPNPRPGHTSRDIYNLNIPESEFPEPDSGYSAQAKDPVAPLAMTPLSDTFQSR